MATHHFFSASVHRALRRGAIAVIPTDTIYGVVCSALMPNSVGHLHKLRSRPAGKPFIVLIPSMRSLRTFGVSLNAGQRTALRQLWPGRVSVILPVRGKRLRYLHRGTNTLAFRVPANTKLHNLLRKVGPLVAPSANPAGKPPATTVAQARRYFGTRVDLYVDGGTRKGKPSTLVALDKGSAQVLRQGAG